MPSLDNKQKDPTATLTYNIDLLADGFIVEGDSVASPVSWTSSPVGIVVDSQSETATKISVILSSGLEGTNYIIEGQVNTTNGEVFPVAFELSIVPASEVSETVRANLIQPMFLADRQELSALMRAGDAKGPNALEIINKSIASVRSQLINLLGESLISSLLAVVVPETGAVTVEQASRAEANRLEELLNRKNLIRDLRVQFRESSFSDRNDWNDTLTLTNDAFGTNDTLARIDAEIGEILDRLTGKSTGSFVVTPDVSFPPPGTSIWCS